MRIQLILLTLCFSLSAMATDEKNIRALFLKYDKIMNNHQVELVDEVFSKKFLADVGGKSEFISKVKSLPKSTEKSLIVSKVSWKPGVKDGQNVRTLYRLPIKVKKL